jgi:hypothetical protein
MAQRQKAADKRRAAARGVRSATRQNAPTDPLTVQATNGPTVEAGNSVPKQDSPANAGKATPQSGPEPPPQAIEQPPGDTGSARASTATATVTLSVTLIRGGLTNVRAPVAVGPRYDGLPLAGATKAFDQLLDSWLTRAIDLGMIGSGLGQLFPVNLERAQQSGKMKVGYLLLAGMGDPGRFAPDDLRFLIYNIVVAVKSLGHDQVALPLIGTRRKEMSVGDAVRGLIEGILDGYERLHAISNVVRDGRDRLREAAERPLYLLLIDPGEGPHNQNDAPPGPVREGAAQPNQQPLGQDEARDPKLRQMYDAFDALKNGVVPNLTLDVIWGGDVEPDRGSGQDTGPKLGDDPADTDPDEPLSLLRITKNRGSGTTDNKPSDTELFQFSALSELAAVPVREEEINAYLVREFPDRMTKECSLDERRDLGRFFANSLVPEDFKMLMESARNLIIEVDETTTVYPWEMAAHKKRARTEFLGIKVPVSRQFRTLLSPPPSSPPALNNKLKALVVADPAPETRLTLAGARDEGRVVVEILDQAFITWKDRYDIEVKVRIGSPGDQSAKDMLADLKQKHRCVKSAETCDPFELMMLIVNEQFDLIHYAGHGRFDRNTGRAGWVFGENCFLSAHEIFRVRQVPRLVFANACFSVAIPGESARYDHLAGVAQAFFARGIPNFIGTGWKVDDACAKLCAQSFYTTVLGLKRPVGKSPPATIGVALLQARTDVLNFRERLASWGAYQHYGRVSDKLLPFINASGANQANAQDPANPHAVNFAAQPTSGGNAVGANTSADGKDSGAQVQKGPAAGTAGGTPPAAGKDPNLIYVNGIDYDTGEYAFKPISIEEMANYVLIRPRAEAFSNLHVESPRSFGIPFGMDPQKLDETGWGIIFHEDTPPDVRAALGPLIEARRKQAGDRLKVLDFRKGEQTRSWYQRHRMSAGNIDPEIVPYYLLLVGSPEFIPYEFQYLLGVEYAVGRLSFEKAGDYERYAHSIIAYETDKAAPNKKEIAYWGTRHLGDPATNLSASLLIEPLANGIAGAAGALKRPIHADVGYGRTLRLGEDATKAALLETLHANEAPAMLFTASHGMAVRSGQPKQRTDQGALLCQDWPSFGSVKAEHILAAADIADDANVSGLVAFVFACYGAGTPDVDQFLMDLNQAGQAPPLAPQPFIAALPQRLLAHPNGSALAVIGHVDRAWGLSIQAPKIQDAQIGTFRSSIGYMLSGFPIGHAMCGQFGARFAALSSALSSATSPTAPRGMQLSDRDLVTYWLERNDAQNYVMLGDPAVRIRKDRV